MAYEEEYYISRAYSNKIRNAADRGLEFSLTYSEFKRIYTRKTCAYTGIQLMSIGLRSGSEDTPPNARTIDRVDNKRGYVSGNCVCVSHVANQAKSLFELGGDHESTATGMSLNGAIKMFENIGKIIQNVR